MNAEEDQVFLKTFGIVMLVLGAIAVFSFFAAYFVGVVTSSDGHPEQAMLAQKRTQPAYQVITDVDAASETDTEEEASGEQAKSGEEVFESLCSSCHVSGTAGAPEVSDPDEWEQRLAERGIDTLHEHAIEGFNAMPPRGGDSSLSDDEVTDAVEFMLDKAGVDY